MEFSIFYFIFVKPSLINIYIEAMKDHFSYLFINLTQKCEPEVKYLSQLFGKDHSAKSIGRINVRVLDFFIYFVR